MAAPASNQNVLKLKQRLEQTIKPLAPYSTKFKPRELSIKMQTFDHRFGHKFLAIVPQGVTIQNIHTNKILKNPVTIKTYVFIPHQQQRFAYLLDKQGNEQYRTLAINVKDLSNILDLKIKPKKYVEYDKQIFNKTIDQAIKINWAIIPKITLISSNYFNNFNTDTSGLRSGIELQSQFNWKQVSPYLILNYAAFSLDNSVGKILFSTWQLGLGINLLPFKWIPNSILRLALLSSFSYQAKNPDSSTIEFSSSTIRLTWLKKNKTEKFNFLYGVSLAREQLGIKEGYNLKIINSDPIYLTTAFIGFDFAL